MEQPFRKSVSILRLVAANRLPSPLFLGFIFVYPPSLTLPMGSYFAGTITESASHQRCNINDLETVWEAILRYLFFNYQKPCWVSASPFRGVSQPQSLDRRWFRQLFNPLTPSPAYPTGPLPLAWVNPELPFHAGPEEQVISSPRLFECSFLKYQGPHGIPACPLLDDPFPSSGRPCSRSMPVPARDS